MCILTQYLAFSGTNLLTRCHSASSCFLLFLCFRKVLHEIFLELHGKKTQRLIIPSRSQSQKGTRSGATGRTDTKPARLAASESASLPIYYPYRENPGPERKSTKISA